jgi:glutamyl-tRNA synthetase
LKPEGNGKLSKRDGDRLGFPVFPLEWKDPNTGEISSGYREKGYYAEAFVNMISLLGWNPGTEKEIFSMDELIESFSFERVHKAGARFDPEKAKWFNEQYLRLQNDEQMGMHLYTYLQNFSGASAESKSLQFATGAVRLLKERVQFEHDFYETGKYLFERPETYDEKVVAKRYNEQSHTFINAMIETYTSVGEFSSENCKTAFEKQAAEMNVKPGDVLQLFRVCVSGVGSGVDLFGMVSLLGKQEILIRLQQALEKINSVAAH